jgi:hypothetical protein
VAEPTFLDEAIEEVVDAVSYYQLVAAPGTAQRLFLEAKAIVQCVLEWPRRYPVEQNGSDGGVSRTFPTPGATRSTMLVTSASSPSSTPSAALAISSGALGSGAGPGPRR